MAPALVAMLIGGLWLLAASPARGQSAVSSRAPAWHVGLQLQQARAPTLLMRPQPKPWQVHDALMQREQDTARVFVDFRPRSTRSDLRDLGTLRMQLSSQGTLSLRPRRGGVQMAWKANF